MARSNNVEMVGLRMSKEVKDKLEAGAVADHRSLSSYIRKILTELVEVADHEAK